MKINGLGEVPEVSDTLKSAIERSKGFELTEEDVRQQRISFAYGNDLRHNSSSREDVERASLLVKLAV